MFANFLAAQVVLRYLFSAEDVVVECTTRDFKRVAERVDAILAVEFFKCCEFFLERCRQSATGVLDDCELRFQFVSVAFEVGVIFKPKCGSGDRFELSVWRDPRVDGAARDGVRGAECGDGCTGLVCGDDGCDECGRVFGWHWVYLLFCDRGYYNMTHTN